MADICSMDIWFDVMASSQGYEGGASSRDILVCHGSENRSPAGVQLVGECSVEEEVKYNIPRQENIIFLTQEDT